MFIVIIICFFCSFALAQESSSSDESLDGLQLDLEPSKKVSKVWYKPKTTVKAYGGWAHYQLSHAEYGLRIERRLNAKGMFWDLNTGGWWGQKKAFASDEGRSYTLVPLSLGLGWRLNEGQRFRPYLSMGLSSLLYHIDPQTLSPSFAVGARGRIGLEYLITDQSGWFIDAEPGVVYAKSIRVLVDPEFAGITSQFVIRSGILLQF